MQTYNFVVDAIIERSICRKFNKGICIKNAYSEQIIIEQNYDLHFSYYLIKNSLKHYIKVYVIYSITKNSHPQLVPLLVSKKDTDISLTILALNVMNIKKI